MKVQKRVFGQTKTPCYRKITTEFPVYAFQDAAGVGYYSWSNSVVSATSIIDFAQTNGTYLGLWKTDEFIGLMRTYQFVSIKGFSIAYYRSINAAQAINWLNLPPMYIAPLFDDPVAGAYDNDTAISIDGNLHVSLLSNEAMGPSRYYAMPGYLSLSGGYGFGANSFTTSYHMYNGPGSYSFVVILGYSVRPTSSATPPTTITQQVGTVRVSAYCEFAVGMSTPTSYNPA